MANYKQACVSDGAPVYFLTPAGAVYFEETTEAGETEKISLPDKIESLSTSNAGIKKVQYAASSSWIPSQNWQNQTANPAWQDSMPDLNSDKPYLYLKILFNDESSIVTFAGSLGKSGEAGIGIEWVYRATVTDTDAIIKLIGDELVASIDDNYQKSGVVPDNWSDSLPEPTEGLPVVFGARRIYKNGTWEKWLAPIIVARKFTIADGENTFLKKTEEDTAQKRITFKDGITTEGNVEINNKEGETNTTQINTSLNVTGDANFKNINVSGQAHFSTLVLDEIKAAGGTYLFSVANPFTVKKFEEVDKGYKVWWKAESENSYNTWVADDYAICAQWDNVKTGPTTDACNKYYWAKVVEASPEKAGYYGEVDGDYCHWIIISKEDKDGDGIPAVGDNIAQLGNSSDTARQSAIVISSYHWVDSNVSCPAFVQYTGIKSFSLADCIRNKIDKNGTTLKGNFSSENNGTFVTTDGIAETIETQIRSAVGELKFLTQSQTKSAGLIIDIDKGITLEASKTTINGDLNLKGLLTDSISQIDNSIYAHGNSVVIPIDMNTVKSVEVSPNGTEMPPIVLLPMYDDQTIVDKTSTDSGLTIPGYTQSGTHLIIRNPFNPAYSLWNVDSNTLWDTDRETIMKQLIVICVDPRLLKESNYHDDSKAYINPSAMEDYAGGVYFNGRRGRFICLLPGQQIELISTIKTIDGKSYLSWYGSGSNIEGFSQDFKFVSDAAPNVAVSYTKLPSNSGWGTTTGIYEDAIFGYPKLASSGQWEVNWAQSNYPSLIVN